MVALASDHFTIPQVYTFQPAFVIFFVTCQMIAWIGLTIVLLTAYFSCNVRRHIVWYNFCISWLICGISFSLLTIAGQQFAPRLDFKLCLVQASLMYSCPILSAGATLALVIHLWFDLTSLLNNHSPRTIQQWDFVLVVFPNGLSFAMFVAMLKYGSDNLHNLQRSYTGTHCDFSTVFLNQIVAAWVFICTIAALILQFFVAMRLRRHWKVFRALGSLSTQSLSMIIRAAIFTFWCLFAMVVAPPVFANSNTALIDGVVGLLSVSTLLIFGTHRDIMHAWIFWKTKPPIAIVVVNASSPRCFLE